MKGSSHQRDGHASLNHLSLAHSHFNAGRREKEEQFVEVLPLCTLFFLCLGLVFMLLASLTAMGLQKRGYDASLVLNMGKGLTAEKETEVLKDCAKGYRSRMCGVAKVFTGSVMPSEPVPPAGRRCGEGG